MAYLRKTLQADIVGFGTLKGMPLILNDDYSVHLVSQYYFLFLLKRVVVGSVYTYAGHIADFISQLEVDGKTISDIDDNWLRAYKKALIHRDGNDSNTNNYASQVMRTVINYCYWLTENGYERALCGVDKLNKIQIELTRTGSIRHILNKNTNTDKRPVFPPKTEWINLVKVYGPQREDLQVRFELMMDWGSAAGLRADEACHLKKKQLPSLKAAEKALDDETDLIVELTHTKGNKRAKIKVNPVLVIKTWNYIELYRDVVVEKFRKEAKVLRKTFKESSYIFLSSTTGVAITTRGFSNSVRTAFLAAVNDGELNEQQRVWLHGLRHNFINVTLKMHDSNNQKNSEELTIRQSRHGSVDAMQPYTGARYDENFS